MGAIWSYGPNPSNIHTTKPLITMYSRLQPSSGHAGCLYMHIMPVLCHSLPFETNSKLSQNWLHTCNRYFISNPKIFQNSLVFCFTVQKHIATTLDQVRTPYLFQRHLHFFNFYFSSCGGGLSSLILRLSFCCEGGRVGSYEGDAKKGWRGFWIKVDFEQNFEISKKFGWR